MTNSGHLPLNNNLVTLHKGQNVKRWSHAEPEHFNVIFAQPKPSSVQDHDHHDHVNEHDHGRVTDF